MFIGVVLCCLSVCLFACLLSGLLVCLIASLFACLLVWFVVLSAYLFVLLFWPGVFVLCCLCLFGGREVCFSDCFVFFVCACGRVYLCVCVCLPLCVRGVCVCVRVLDASISHQSRKQHSLCDANLNCQVLIYFIFRCLLLVRLRLALAGSGLARCK